jgi:serine/threonine protein kinase
MKESDACVVTKQIASALVYLHNFNMCHGDLKPENIMLKNPGDLTAGKLIDFGYSHKISAGSHQDIPIGTVAFA